MQATEDNTTSSQYGADPNSQTINRNVSGDPTRDTLSDTTSDVHASAQAWAQNGVDMGDQRSLGRLFSDLSYDLSNLVRKEILLARTETMEKVSTAARGAISIGAGALVAYAGFIFLMAAAVLGLATFMPYWLATVIVAVVLLVVGLIFIQSGRSMLRPDNLAPTKTMDTMKDNAEMVKEKIQ